MWKLLHIRWTVLLKVEWIVILWTLSGRYCTASYQCCCWLNGVFYSEHYVEVTAQQVESGVAGWKDCVSVNIMWKILHSRLSAVLQFKWSVLLWTLRGRCFTTGGQWYCRLNGACYSEHYSEGTAHHLDSFIAGWMECVTVKIIWKIIRSRWTVVLQVEWNELQLILCLNYWTVGGGFYCSK